MARFVMVVVVVMPSILTVMAVVILIFLQLPLKILCK